MKTLILIFVGLPIGLYVAARIVRKHTTKVGSDERLERVAERYSQFITRKLLVR